MGGRHYPAMRPLRAVQCALNDFGDRVRVVESDAWSTLEGETFDLVVAHPPYVPALSHRFDFRDGGEDGEQVARRIVDGLGAHLRPGGRFVMTAALSDRRGAPIAQRVREWLGAAGMSSTSSCWRMASMGRWRRTRM